jgi:hypothetical protein
MKRLLLTLAVASGVLAQTIDPADLVTLEMRVGVSDGCGPLKIDFFRLTPEGISQEKPFRVPSGSYLVITDVDWYYINGVPGATQILRLIVENLKNSSKRGKALESTALLSALGTGGRNEHLTTGFAVAPEARLCLELNPGPMGDPMRLSNIIVRGYLAQ